MALNGLMRGYLISSGDGGCRGYLTGDFQVFLGADIGNTGIGGQLGFKRNVVFFISALHTKDTQESLGNLESQTLPH